MAGSKVRRAWILPVVFLLVCALLMGGVPLLGTAFTRSLSEGSVAAALSAEQAAAIDALTEEEAVAGEVVVGFKDGTTFRQAAEAVEAIDGLSGESLDPASLASSAPIATLEAEKDIPLSQVIGQLLQSDLIEFAQPNFRYRLAAEEDAAAPSSAMAENASGGGIPKLTLPSGPPM